MWLLNTAPFGLPTSWYNYFINCRGRQGRRFSARERKTVQMMTMRRDEQTELGARLTNLRLEDIDLDSTIKALEGDRPNNELKVKRLKKQKLPLKDEIVRIEDYLTPDIIA